MASNKRSSRPHRKMGIPLASVVSITIGLALSLSLPFVESASANSSVRWKPSPKMGSASSTLSGGRRGQDAATCTNGNFENATTITLLTPSNGQGLLTTQAHPTFSWYLNTAKPVSTQFILTDPAVAKPVFTTTLQASAKGIYTVQLPADIALRLGTQYRWAVLVACAERPASEIYARSFVERVERRSLQEKVAGGSPLEKAAAYAADGIWYDALGTLVAAHRSHPESETTLTALKSLLNQADDRPAQADRELSRIANQL